MRTRPLLRLLGLALVACPLPVHADPIDDICSAAGPSAATACEGFGPDYDADFIAECNWAFDRNTSTYVWYAQLVARRATAIRIECYQGTSYVSRTTEGQVGYVADSVVAPRADTDICTQIAIKYMPGNPYGRDPDSFYQFAPLCRPEISIG